MVKSKFRFFPPFPFRSNVHLSHKMRMLIKIIIVVYLHVPQYIRLVHACLVDVFIIDYYACLKQTVCTKLFLCKNARNLLLVSARQPKRLCVLAVFMVLKLCFPFLIIFFFKFIWLIRARPLIFIRRLTSVLIKWGNSYLLIN